MFEKAHFFQHVHFEDLAEIKTWLENNNIHISSTRFFDNWKEPNIDSLDLLIIK